ncbi:MAG: hypothetical protein NT045_09095 [Candidatus Aureabacteria bacterium]|nr:hypothetical protein [Candidatus Auribacterota bacterium]
MPVCQISTGSSPAAQKEKIRWFGASKADFSCMRDFAGTPLMMKARFVRETGDGGQVKKSDRKPSRVTFLVSTGNGEATCEIDRASRDAKALGEMKIGTPLVLSGTVHARRDVFVVKGVVRGWGKDALAGRRN